MNKLILAGLMSMFLSTNASALCSNLVIEYTNENGSPVTNVPDNKLLDTTCGLNQEEAEKHHYALKAAYGKALYDAVQESVETNKATSFSKAVR